MDTFSLELPSNFVLENIPWTWRDLLYGIESSLINPSVAVDAAVSRLYHEQEPRAEVVDLAGCSPSDGDIIDHVRVLANAENENRDIRDHWVYLVLRWVLENRSLFQDPLQMVEQVYADFGFPEAIAPLVRFMPSDEPDLGSLKLNEERLFKRWQSFLDGEASRFGKQS